MKRERASSIRINRDGSIRARGKAAQLLFEILCAGLDQPKLSASAEALTKHPAGADAPASQPKTK